MRKIGLEKIKIGKKTQDKKSCLKKFEKSSK